MKTRASLSDKRAQNRLYAQHCRRNPSMRAYEQRYSRIYRAEAKIECAFKNQENGVLKARLERKRDVIADLRKQVGIYEGLLQNLNEQLKTAERKRDKFRAMINQERVPPEPQWHKLPFARNILENEKMCQSVLHMTHDEFFALANEFSSIILKTGLKGKTLDRNSSSKISVEEKLFTTLVFMSLYPSWDLVGV